MSKKNNQTCADPDCGNARSSESRYCTEHRCIFLSIKSKGNQCKNKKLIDKKYCHRHKNLQNFDLQRVFNFLKNPYVFTVFFTLIIVLFGPSIHSKFLGYKLDIDFYETANNLYEGLAVVEIENVGGYSLHNVKGRLNFICRGFDKKDFGEGTLDGPIKILERGASKALFFDNETLIKYIRGGLNDCADAVVQVYSLRPINEERSEIEKAELYEYYLDNDSFIIKEVNPNYHSFKLCAPCEINITIYSDEKNFSVNERFVFSKRRYSVKFSNGSVQTVGYKHFTFTNVMTSNKTNFSHSEQSFKDYLENKLTIEFGYGPGIEGQSFNLRNDNVTTFNIIPP